MIDVLILGGGPAGLTAALYAARARMKTVILEKQSPGGQVLLTAEIENYPGFESIAGFELVQTMVTQAERFGAEIKVGEAKSISKNDGGTFSVETDSETLQSRTVIIATGRQPRRIGIDGEMRLLGRGVSYCATCDGAFFRGRKVAVIGGGDSAVEEAIFLTKFASQVTIVHRRDELRAVKYLQEKAFANEKINFKWSHIPLEIKGGENVEALRLKNLKTGEENILEVDGVFIFIGFIPNTEFVENLLDLADDKSIITDETMATGIPGLFAAGDVRHRPLYQIATAIGDGAQAGVSAEKFIELQE